MPPAVVSAAERRKLGENEDMHCRGGRAQAESLLGQALQLPSLGSQNYQSNHGEDEDNEGVFSYESLTPTFATRKRSSDGNRTPIKTNFSHRPHHTANNNNNHQHTNHNGRPLNHRNLHNSMSSASTRLVDNRGMIHNSSGNVSGASSSQDPLCMSNRSLQSEDFPPVIPQSVDTVPTSNVANHATYQQYKRAAGGGVSQILNGATTKLLSNSPLTDKQQRMSVSPPSNLIMQHQTENNNNNNIQAGRRTVFGSRVQRKYPAYGRPVFNPPPPPDPAPFYNILYTGEQQVTFQKAEQQPPDWEILPSSPRPVRNSFVKQQQELSAQIPLSMVVTTTTTTSTTTTESSDSSRYHHAQGTTCSTTIPIPISNNRESSDITMSPPPSPSRTTRQSAPKTPTDLVSPLKSPPVLYHTNTAMTTQRKPSSRKRKSSRKAADNASTSARSISIHETVHAQSLLLGLCFMAIWSPNNVMAPNLTQVAKFYHMNENERDLYLGSFLALATGVCSFPLSAFIGILTDLYPRKILFVATAMGGAMASAATGLSPTYPYLLLARFFSGGFMSASVSVAFSLMGDLFATEERNAASSGLTAMMGLGIILGQVYAGTIANEKGWQHAFYVSSVATVVLGLCVALLVQEPVRGGKEKVLQDMLKQGKRYDRKLTWEGFWNAMRNNRSNRIIIIQGFFTNIPWGIIFVFLNDYLSQERGFSVTDATFIVLVFGIGCAAGGIVGGAMGAAVQAFRRSFLPLFMAGTTILGIFPYLALLNGHTTNAHGYWAMTYSFMAGCIANLPSVNVRPCLINVNPPETRGASLTAANLIINFARGVGPSFITLLGSTFDLSRQASFNITLTAFWLVSALQLCLLAQYLPQDQDKMEADLAHYAASAMATTPAAPNTPGDRSYGSASMDDYSLDHPESGRSLDEVSLVSIEDRITSFDGTAARESISFLKKGVKELNISGHFCVSPYRQRQRWYDEEEEDDSGDDEEENQREEALKHLTSRSAGDDALSPVDLLKRRDLWKQQQLLLYGSAAGDQTEGPQEVDGTSSLDEQLPANESTRLLV
ncbi:Eukaryotic translation initiation factor 4 gamma [Seminavis robusta]|uniref:Eukaryotic translation initiation factor 4 gamma n=1 Tax=Seminavis robusta TaxID=568900 RepID=A0A9N8DZL1_9STRA|nr:Eukaryotic translation initiation factor 4 gamma [Seminavis robusta]|eukprot:Sro504_g155910.1 Eukaryotic translation initiation factor 4 gamma (1057) ;mRNA; f:6223-9393